jgi:pyrroline-5-carboxylate reductase
MTLNHKKIVFIGGGMMATAIINGLLENNLLPPHQITVADPNTQRGTFLTETYDLHYTPDNVTAVNGANVVILAVKPQFFDAVAADIGGRVGDTDFVLSIMAGVATDTIDHKLQMHRIVRAMPNTPGAIGAGMTAWMATDAVSPDAIQIAGTLLASLGQTLQVPKETYLDMATAVSGSGPAYVLLFMEAMIDAAVHLGFSRADAETLVRQTLRGTIDYAAQSDLPLTTLRHQVTSPGGTTAEALYHMEREGLRHAVTRGIWAAFQRSQMLGGTPPRNPDTSA